MNGPMEPAQRSPGKGGRFRSLIDRRGAIPRVEQFTSGSDSELGTAVLACLLSGRGLLLAPTSDGGALSCTVYEGDERSRSYASSAEEYREILEALTDLGGGSGPAPTTGRKSR